MQAYDYFFEDGYDTFVRIRRGADWGIRFYPMNGRFAFCSLSHSQRIKNKYDTLCNRSRFLKWLYGHGGNIALVKQSNETLAKDRRITRF